MSLELPHIFEHMQIAHAGLQKHIHCAVSIIINNIAILGLAVLAKSVFFGTIPGTLHHIPPCLP
jgi:hypothetical protein